MVAKLYLAEESNTYHLMNEFSLEIYWKYAVKIKYKLDNCK